MSHDFEAARAAVLNALTAYAQSEPRVQALWLQGSLATGGADAFSDIDAYVAVEDHALEAVWAEREPLLECLGGPLAWADAPAPGMSAVHALTLGGVRLDLFYERASTAPSTPRPIAAALVDKTGLTARLDLSWRAAPAEVGRILQTIIRMTRQEATWPLRVLGRGQWGTLAKIDLDLINAQLMAVAHDASYFYRNPNALAPLLTAAQNAELAALSDAALAALVARDLAALKAVQLRVHDTLVREGRAACAALGVEYPISDEGEAGVRALLEEAWPG